MVQVSCVIWNQLRCLVWIFVKKYRTDDLYWSIWSRKVWCVSLLNTDVILISAVLRVLQFLMLTILLRFELSDSTLNLTKIKLRPQNELVFGLVFKMFGSGRVGFDEFISTPRTKMQAIPFAGLTTIRKLYYITCILTCIRELYIVAYACSPYPQISP